ncbi:MAG TPA: TIGR00159 family protein [Candidatus Excrementavichristensenella intestinipullorum]|nr:TIGR00159 family protein [Candidatus Excrementavichristensenella intestinipullorum]
MTGIQNVFLQATAIFSNLFNYPDWRNLLDILIVATLIYQILRLFVHTRASSLVKGIFMMLAVTWLSEVLQLNALNWLMLQVLNTGMLLLIVLFQPELRKGLEQVGRTGYWARLVGAGGKERRERERIVTELTNALTDLSRKRIGALIVVERRTGLSDVMESGTHLDAEISAALVENIFEPNTPLHDGAVIIKDERIVAAACILQLTENTALSRELGTRHRAAIGVSENTDAVVLIVSEETGIISTARDGRLTRYLDKKSLTALLTELFVPNEVTLRQSVGRMLRPEEDRHEEE